MWKYEKPNWWSMETNSLQKEKQLVLRVLH
jgi:hypothetical protein